MYVSNPLRTAAILPVFIIVVTIMAIKSNAHDDEHQQGSGSLKDSVAVEQIPLRDSVYADINQSYLKIKPIFKEKCFDCHSETTNYPWYHSLPGIGALIDDHIHDGRKHIDFSNDFPFKTKHDLLETLGDLREEIEENEMPIMGYRLLHWGKTIEGTQQDSVFTWIDQTIESLKQFQDSSVTQREESDHDSDDDD